MKLKICILAMLLPLLQGLHAQTLKPLNTNDKVPAVVMQMVNYNKPTARLSDFKNKLLILDFWSSRCGACIHHFAELDSLQSVFKNRVAILAVSSKPVKENSQTVRAFIKGYKQRIQGGFNFPCVVNDAILYKLFPHNSIPHYVWISAAGKFLGATAGEEVNAANITAVLSNKPLTAQVKSPLKNYDPSGPLFPDGNRAQQRLLYRSLFTGRISGLNTSAGYWGDADAGKITKLFAINVTPVMLYKHAYPAAAFFYNNRVVCDNTALLNDTTAYCYELITPPAGDSTIHKKMQEDLHLFFKTGAAIQQRSVVCYVLSVTDTTLLPVGNGEPGNTLYENIPAQRTMVNQPLSALAERLNELLAQPVVDETGFTQPLNLTLPNNLTDLTALAKTLAPQGLALTRTTRMLSLLVLTADAPQQQNPGAGR